MRLRTMTRTLEHRGPDGEGFHCDGPVGLGMRRLAIIDVAGGDQPLYNEDRSVAVVQNGEIYNYQELRGELQEAGHTFRTHSDTEVLVHGYEQWGEDLVHHLNGMWAFALWDSDAQRLLLSRDRLGIKPLYWSWHDDTLLFGSELKALLRAGCPPRPNAEVLDAYVSFGFVPEPHSFYQDIECLPAGCNLVMEADGRPHVRRYWEVPIVDESAARRDEPRIVEEFAALLRDAVRLQMRSDVPLGAFLSGGLDSASIVALAAEESSRPVRTFTIGFDEPAFDERELARSVADRYRTLHQERVVHPDDFVAGLQVMQAAFDQPFGDSSALATWVVSGIARQQVTVTLTGDGGDEVLAGYTRYQGEKFSQSWGQLPGFVRRHLVPSGVHLAHAVSRGTARRRLERVERVVDAANMTFEERITRKQSWSDAALRRALLQGNRHAVRPAIEYVEDVMRACPATDPFHRLSWFDFKMMLPSQMLTKVDRMSMAHSLEARVPFLDHRLVELLAPVSANVKLPGYTRKNVLRKAMSRHLPDSLMRAGKKGFNVPLRDWFAGGPAGRSLEVLLQDPAVHDQVHVPTVQRLLQEHRRGERDHATQLWILLQLAQWGHGIGAVPA
jgi:asparagine synthase (glutamine-hydrolysing)